jgi:NAD dependent epimerase/dehydratase family
MVAISPPAKVLVTGANGYLATWVLKKYLEAGYSVRGTVRSLSKSAFLNEKFAQYGDRFELVVVEDITKDGAFDEAVKGVDAIAHTASPFHYNATNPDGMSDFPRLLTLLALKTYPSRSHHPCRARNYIDPELCLETWRRSEACDLHLFGCGGSRRYPGAACFQRKQLE